ncbi:MAG TPA: M20/M25/M40 family metallo-hydrolase, partial [Phycisphaerales bacterium]|nr:M20/M25/M40 family metallo-hydrolase [Phycisphaerales bacterium]
EAARLLAVSGARPKRTIRFILWTGEEQGLLGSRSWVERHADELPRISAVFVDDGGTNYEGGLGCPDSMVEMLAAATAPVNNQFYSKADGKYLNVNIHSTGDRMPRSGGSDHVSFVQRGVPGFFWDEVGRAEYGYGWHTQHDRLDLAIPEYLRQSATCAAITAYNLACAESLLPRVPLPPPGEPGERRRGERRPDGGNAADGRPRGPAAPGAPPAPTPPGPAAIPGEPAPGQGAAPPAPAPAEPPAPASPARPEPEPK